eukprot:1797632-Rhodomonas_salina.1
MLKKSTSRKLCDSVRTERASRDIFASDWLRIQLAFRVGNSFRSTVHDCMSAVPAEVFHKGTPLFVEPPVRKEPVGWPHCPHGCGDLISLQCPVPYLHIINFS